MKNQVDQNKFFLAQPWIREILALLKKELKTEHLPGHREFHLHHFSNRPLHRISLEELIAVYERELLKGDQALGDWVVSRWICKHGDVYHHFSERLGEITEDFSSLTVLSESDSERILAGAKEAFGPVVLYLFSLLNGVVFPETVMDRLRIDASLFQETQKKNEEELIETKTLQSLKEHHDRELRRLKEKYEGKLAGLEKKYTLDTEMLKKQIRSLQKQPTHV